MFRLLFHSIIDKDIHVFLHHALFVMFITPLYTVFFLVRTLGNQVKWIAIVRIQNMYKDAATVSNNQKKQGGFVDTFCCLFQDGMFILLWRLSWSNLELFWD
jgi:hypothetical protein